LCRLVGKALWDESYRVRGNLRTLGKLLLRSFSTIGSLRHRHFRRIFPLSVYTLPSSQALTHQEPKSEIDPVIDAKLRKLTEKTVEKVAQTP